MAITPITPLPQAPSRSAGPVAFNALADPFIAALPPFVLQANALAAGISEAVAGIAFSVSAAADSASASATSASAANDAKVAAQQAVVDAGEAGAEQTALAVTAKNEAQAAALAAGAAAGLPEDRVPFSVLQVNGLGEVGWGDGVPDTAAALAGQALILSADKTPGWGYAGNQIGDVLYTARAPEAMYLPANGGIYSQSAYPQLFAQIGLIGGQRATAFVAKSATPPFEQMAFGENGVVLGVSATAGSVGYVYRSTDYGNTFTQVSNLNDTSGLSTLAHLGGSRWLVAPGAAKIFLSNDNGTTFTTVTVPSPVSRIATDKTGTVVAATNGPIIRSTDYGLSFQSIPFSQGNIFLYAGMGRWIANYIASITTHVCVSDDAFGTYTVKPLNGTINGTPSYMDVDHASGVIVIGSTNGGVSLLNLAISYDRGESFGVVPAGGAYPIRTLVNAGADTWLVLCVSGSNYEIRKSTNGAKTFTQGPVTNTQVPPQQLPADPLKGYVIANCRLAGNGSYSVSAPVLGYDGATQFKLPTLAKTEGVNPYIRAI